MGFSHVEGTVLTTLSWFFSIFNILGTLLNIKNSPYSFFIWTICNIFWVYYDSCMLMHSRLLIDVINLMMSTYGFIIWSRCSKNGKYLKRGRSEKNSEHN